MIFLGIVEYVNPITGEVKVRVPQLHGVDTSSTIFIPTERIRPARMNSFPGVNYTLKVNDVVTVAFYNWDSAQPVILGTVNNYNTETSRDLTASIDSLKVTSDAELPKETKIGEITYDELKHLKGLSYNVADKLLVLDDSVKQNSVDIANLNVWKSSQYSKQDLDNLFNEIATKFSDVTSDITGIQESGIDNVGAFLNNFKESFNYYQKVLCDYACMQGLSNYSYLYMPLNNDGTIDGFSYFTEGVPIQRIGDLSFGEALVTTAQLWIDEKDKFSPKGSTAYSKLCAKYKNAYNRSFNCDSVRSKWCALAVSALYMFQDSKDAYESPSAFQFSASVSYIMWSGKDATRNIAFPYEYCNGAYGDYLIPIKEFKSGGKYYKDNKPDIRPGDIGICKYIRYKKQNGIINDDAVNSHTYYVVDTIYDKYKNSYYLKCIGGNNGHGENLGIEIHYIESNQVAGIVRPSYNIKSDDPIPSKTRNEVYAEMKALGNNTGGLSDIQKERIFEPVYSVKYDPSVRIPGYNDIGVYRAVLISNWHSYGEYTCVTGNVTYSELNNKFRPLNELYAALNIKLNEEESKSLSNCYVYKSRTDKIVGIIKPGSGSGGINFTV